MRRKGGAFAERLNAELAGRACSLKVFGATLAGGGLPGEGLVIPVWSYVDELGMLGVLFSSGDRLAVWEPDRLSVQEGRARIGRARRVLWEWFYVGRPQTPANRHEIHFAVRSGGIAVRKTGPDRRALVPKDTEAAVELYG